MPSFLQNRLARTLPLAEQAEGAAPEQAGEGLRGCWVSCENLIRVNGVGVLWDEKP